MIHKFLALSLAAATRQLGFAASHREAPLIALDPAADITGVYAFRSYGDPGKLVFIMNVIPGQEPSAGPNYFNFDDDVAYCYSAISAWLRHTCLRLPMKCWNGCLLLQTVQISSYGSYSAH